MSTNPPTSELGRTNPQVSGIMKLARWASFWDDNEVVPELQWPTSVRSYDIMRGDSQLQALLTGTTWPIRRYRWMLDPNGARPELVEALSADLGLDVVGADPGPRRRQKRRFSHDRHLAHALLALVWGHMYFEQVGEIDESGMWRLRKLAPRMPSSIHEIKVAEDGGLVGIRQNLGMNAPMIPVSRLVGYVFDQEGGNWIGRSMLRACYKHWLIKDRLLRVDAIKHQRTGMGVPVVEAPPNATPQQIAALDQLAREFKVGEAAGGAIPSGSRLRLETPTGNVPDAIASVRYHDEQMARRFLMMFTQLGSTETGSRALGESFMDFFFIAQQSVAGWYCDTFNEHVIEDWVDWNYGEDEEQAPLLTYESNEDPSLSVADLAALADKGLVTLDDELKGWVRQRYKIPRSAASPATTDGGEPVEEPAEPGAPRARRVKAVSLPDRKLRRQPYAHEVAAQTDFANLDEQYMAARDRLVSRWQDVREVQIGELAALIEEADGDLGRLAALDATPIGADVLREEMLLMMEEGAIAAHEEAIAQGRTVAKPDLDNVAARVANRAEAVDTVMARSLSEAASRKAIALTGSALTPAEVAAETRTYLAGLGDKFLEDQLGGAVNQSINSGRHEVIRVAQDSTTSIYASELLDVNTCDLCTHVDGTEYPSVQASEEDYPTGGYKDCLGGPRCRGTVVAVYGESGASA